MEGVEFENSLLVLTQASLMKSKIPEPLTRQSEGNASESSSPSSSHLSYEDEEEFSPGKSKRKRTRNTTKSPIVVFTTGHDSPSTKAFRGLDKRNNSPSLKNLGEQSSGSEEDLSPIPSTTPAALIAKLDPNLPLTSTLDRSVLLTMSSRDFESFFNQLSTERTLTRSEEKMLKAQRRLISNRESAQASRRRKKAYIEELEGRVSEMHIKMSQVTASNAALNAQITELNAENQLLKSKFEEILKAMKPKENPAEIQSVG
eukprot:TRINITY_DN8070_c0_g1_i1.p1 TRINITY_DN8070_c0_g1~~TRINITY_DN8070_c0_g1_i1.p1  ORF type:complete len:259 (-),score=95.81 TRINITY_DN8070_c0_g1_i1:183-959(-)